MVVHYGDVKMGAIASQITSLTIVYSTVYSDADERKQQSSASLAFVWGSHRGRWIRRTKGQLRGKCFHLMTSSCICGSGKRCIPCRNELWPRSMTTYNDTRPPKNNVSGIFVRKVNIWIVNCAQAQATALILDWRTDVLLKVSNFF